MIRPAISPAGPPVETACCVCSEFGPCLPIQVRGQSLILHVGACCFEAWRKKTGGAPEPADNVIVNAEIYGSSVVYGPKSQVEISGSRWSSADLVTGPPAAGKDRLPR